MSFGSFSSIAESLNSNSVTPQFNSSSGSSVIPSKRPTASSTPKPSTKLPTTAWQPRHEPNPWCGLRTTVHPTLPDILLVTEGHKLLRGISRTDGRQLWKVEGFRNPGSVCTTPDGGKAFVVDCRCVYMVSLSSKNWAPQKIADVPHAEGIAYSATQKRLYVSSHAGHNIRVLHYTGSGLAKEVAQWGSTKGSGDDQFNGPSGLAMGPGDKELYVADEGNHCVKALNATTGAFLRKYEGGDLRRPSGVAVSGDHLLVADVDNKCILGFERVSGKFVGTSSKLAFAPWAVCADGTVSGTDGGMLCNVEVENVKNVALVARPTAVNNALLKVSPPASTCTTPATTVPSARPTALVPNPMVVAAQAASLEAAQTAQQQAVMQHLVEQINTQQQQQQLMPVLANTSAVPNTSGLLTAMPTQPMPAQPMPTQPMPTQPMPTQPMPTLMSCGLLQPLPAAPFAPLPMPQVPPMVNQMPLMFAPTPTPMCIPQPFAPLYAH